MVPKVLPEMETLKAKLERGAWDQLIQAKKAVEVKVNQMSEIYLILILRGYLLGKARHSLGTQIC